jgi:esterase/lipase superfamily enzyme
MLGLQVVETDAWDVPLVGEQRAVASHRSRPWPERPAFLLELLRPKDEAPSTCPSYEVIFGTDRDHNDATNPAAGYSNARAKRLLIGTATVHVGPTPAFGGIGRAWQAAVGHPRRPPPQIRILDDEATISARMQDVAIADKPRGFNLLFVHGYRVNFRDAVEHGARLGSSLKVPGNTYVYSWPATYQYMSDTQTVEASLPHFSDFINRICDNNKSLPLAIIAHSMGNRLLLRFLVQQFGIMPTSLNTISHTVFAAPDVDQDVFQQGMSALTKAPFRKTLYSARGDGALRLSELFNGNPRAGLAPPVVIADNLDTILVEGGPLVNLGHSYYADQTDILHDMFQLFHYSAAPACRRSTKQTATNDGLAYWKIEL